MTVGSPPAFCQYATGPCDQSFSDINRASGIILYPSDPQEIAATIEAAVRDLELSKGSNWLSWRKFSIAGQVIFCEICKRMRFADVVIADITTLNFNLLFEIGFAIGLGIPIVPVRDLTFVADKNEFLELGLLDTLGYRDFRNSRDLVDIANSAPHQRPVTVSTSLNLDAPIYLLKSRHETEAEVTLASVLKSTLINFRTYDVVETPRLSLHEAMRQVSMSIGVVAHLLNEQRADARVHNARCAFVAGLATALGKTVVVLQAGQHLQPIDYRDIVQWYSQPDQISRLLERPLRQVMTRVLASVGKPFESPRGLLQQVDFGDVAAENEARSLRSYFVQTGQYQQARRGHARLVVGRKGAGKTAIFYSLSDAIASSVTNLVLDLKPEGHQFTRLREAVLDRLPPGMQEYMLTAFWSSILLAELARKITDDEITWSHRDPARQERYDRVSSLHEEYGNTEEGDFSQRLLNQVERLSQALSGRATIQSSDVTQQLYRGDIRVLGEAIGSFLELKDEAWLLVDNLDKGWPTRGASSVDILIVRCLLEATRKLQRQLERHGVEFHSMVFLRNDVYEHLVEETPDRGKETPIEITWDDPVSFKEMLRRRIVATSRLDGSFESVWGAIFEPMIGIRPTFNYLVDRTLMRPRDLLMFIRRTVEVAINRGHDKVRADDVVFAEEGYSTDMLHSLAFELRDVRPSADQWLYGFLECPVQLSEADVRSRLAGTPGADEALHLLLWFGFLGVSSSSGENARYAYDVRYDMNKLLAPVNRGAGCFLVHPAFHRALECQLGPSPTSVPASAKRL